MIRTETLRRMPLWQVPLVFILGLGLIALGFILGAVVHLYVAATIIVAGKLLTMVATIVFACGYLRPALGRLGTRFLGIKR